MASLLLSNPPRRNRKGQFTKGTRRKTRRRASTATVRAPARRRRTRRRAGASYTNPPRRTRRRASLGGARKVTVRELLPQAAAGVGGFIITNYGTEWVGRMLPAQVVGKLPAVASPVVKGAVALTIGTVMARHAPRGLRRFAAATAAGGLISAGLDLIDVIRSGRALSGYWAPGMSGYWAPGMGEGQLYFDESMGAYYDPESGTYLESGGGMDGPAILMDSRDLANL